MIARAASEVAAIAYAVTDAAVIMAPSIVLALSARQGGLPGSHGLDLVGASMVIAVIDAVIAYGRLRGETRVAERRVDVWIAAVDSLVVLALGATLLMIAVLGGFAEEHATIINEGWPVLALWVGVLLVAVTLSELSGRIVFRWLEPAAEVHAGLHLRPPGGSRPSPSARHGAAAPARGRPTSAGRAAEPVGGISKVRRSRGE